MDYIASIILFSGIFVSEVVTFLLTFFSGLPHFWIVLLNQGILLILCCVFYFMDGLCEMEPEPLKVFFIGLTLAANELGWLYILKIFPFFVTVIIHGVIWLITGIITLLVALYNT